MGVDADCLTLQVSMDEEPNNMQEPPMLYAQAPIIARAQPPIVPYAQILSAEQRQFTTSTGMPRQVTISDRPSLVVLRRVQLHTPPLRALRGPWQKIKDH
jgi:hypothetical protein